MVQDILLRCPFGDKANAGRFDLLDQVLGYISERRGMAEYLSDISKVCTIVYI